MFYACALMMLIPLIHSNHAALWRPPAFQEHRSQIFLVLKLVNPGLRAYTQLPHVAHLHTRDHVLFSFRFHFSASCHQTRQILSTG